MDGLSAENLSPRAAHDTGSVPDGSLPGALSPERTARLLALAAALGAATTAAQVAEIAVRHGLDALGAQGGAVARLNAGRDALEVLYAEGPLPAGLAAGQTLPLAGPSPLAEAARDGRVVFGAPAGSPDVHSFAAAPLGSGPKPPGALLFGFAAGPAVDDDLRAFLPALGNLCAAALERADQYEAEHRARVAAEVAADQLRRLQRVADSALAHLDLDALLQELLARVAELLSADTVTVLLADEAGTGLRVRASRGLGAAVTEDVRIPIGQGFAGRVAAEGQAVILPASAYAESLSPWLRELRVESLMGVPLVAAGRLIGVLHVGTLQPRRFTDDDRQLLQLAADRVAPAIEQSRMVAAEQRARAEAERAGTRLQTLVDTLPTGVLFVDREGGFTLANPAVQAMLGGGPTGDFRGPVGGYTLHHLDGTPYAPDDLPLPRAVRNGEVVRDAELLVRRADGSEVITITSATPIYDAAGEVAGAVAAMHDVTAAVHARRQVQDMAEQAQRQAAELSTTIESIADGITILGPRGETLLTNPAGMRMLGYGPEDMNQAIAVRASITQPESSSGRKLTVEELPSARALRGETVHGEVLALPRASGGKTWLSVSAAPICAPGGQLLGAVITYTDITALRELERQREDYVHMISHDLRSPLTVILGRAQLIARDLARPDRIDRIGQSAGVIAESARQMAGMIEGLVDSARLDSGQLQVQLASLDLADLVRHTCDKLAGGLPAQRLVLEAPAGLPPVLADPEQVDRILGNLIGNALKYSPPDGKVTVRLAARAGDVVTTIVDQGQGIDAEDVPHLFERYYRGRAGRERREGLGLGLYITRGLVLAQHGRIWVETEAGLGSAFSFSLPVDRAAG